VADVVRIVDACVRRGSALLLSDVNLTIASGERWIVMGPNGAGKTTLLLLASARMFPTSGDVEILDEAMGAVDLAELRPRIGWASSAMATDLPPGESVLDVVMTGAWAVAGRWHEHYDETDRSRAEGLLLDEPGAGLDLGGREDLVERLGRLARDEDAPALVLVTHHVEEIADGFTHGLLLRAGTVVASGPLPAVMTDAALSEAFGLPITVRHDSGRWFARRADQD
jgi:iron complex transport system ATP-binding protein